MRIYIVLLLIFCFVLVKIIQEYGKRKSGIRQEIYDAWHNDPGNWRAGVFYYNPKDPRIFPPKRIGFLGWTINFANPYSVLTSIGFVLLIIATGMFF
jgi:uncharacterized membrane protein